LEGGFQGRKGKMGAEGRDIMGLREWRDGYLELREEMLMV
jgi:hypothetical protein